MLRAAIAIGLCLTVAAVAQELTILDENVDDVIGWASSGEGTPENSTDAYSGSQSLYIGATGGDAQKYNGSVPDWGWAVVENPAADNEFRYITFAWKKDGGTSIMLQLSGDPDGWSHRYHSGVNVKDWNPSLEVQPNIPTDWEVQTMDMFADWGAFALNGMAFSAGDGVGAYYDAVRIGQNESFTAVEAKGKLTTTWAGLRADAR
ncbi:hypothetical protein CMK11_20225 [Candidatus Poribacteria bacterium]|nr:hypothetical protein [Candidatus Poribacteria bacterium]